MCMYNHKPINDGISVIGYKQVWKNNDKYYGLFSLIENKDGKVEENDKPMPLCAYDDNLVGRCSAYRRLDGLTKTICLPDTLGMTIESALRDSHNLINPEIKGSMCTIIKVELSDDLIEGEDAVGYNVVAGRHVNILREVDIHGKET